MSNIDILAKVREHKADYPTFNDVGFLEWFNSKPDSWKRWASGRTVSKLNKSRKFNERMARMP